MKKLKFFILAGIMLLAAGCVSLQFDAGEFDRFVTINEIATNTISKCSDTDVVKQNLASIQIISNHQSVYSSFRQYRPELKVASDNVKATVDAMVKRYGTEQPSVAYCEEKMKIIASETAAVSQTIGRF